MINSRSRLTWPWPQRALILSGALFILVSCEDSGPGSTTHDSWPPPGLDANHQPGDGAPSDGPEPELDQAMAQGCRFAAIADIHPDGDYSRIEALVAAFQREGVDFYAVMGDIPLNGKLRGIEEKTDNTEEIIRSMEIIAGPGLPVYVLPGNHETRPSYEAAMADLAPRFPNITDLAPSRVFELCGMVFAALGGVHDPGYVMPLVGYLYGVEEVQALSTALEGRQGPLALLTHGPPLTKGTAGIDYVTGSGNVGDPALRALIDQHGIRLALSGHIHQAGQRAMNHRDTPVSEGVGSERLFLNVGAAATGQASLVSFQEDKMMFTTIEVP